MLLPLRLNLEVAGVTVGIPSRMIDKRVMPSSVLSARIIRPASTATGIMAAMASSLLARKVTPASRLDGESIMPASDVTGTTIDCGD